MSMTEKSYLNHITNRPNSNEVIGVDLYNQSITGGVAKTLSNKATDSDHIPCVLIINSSGEGICGTLQ